MERKDGKISVVEILDQAIGILSMDGKVKERYVSEIQGLERRKSIADANTYRIGIIGVTSSGKSTLINSFLGESVLPSGVRPSSSQLVRCHHSTKKQAVVYFENGSSKVLQGDSFTQEKISEYADENVNSCNKEGVKEIELLSPGFPFDDDVLLIDSPGLDAFGYDGHERLTMTSLLPTVDMCMLITTCKSNSDEKLREILDTIADSGSSGMPVVIVQNMMDSIRASVDGKKSKREVAKYHVRRLERIISESLLKDSSVSIIQFSAIRALTGRMENNNRKLITSNYFKLLNAVNDKLSFIKPTIDNGRITRVRKELLRIEAEARRDSGSNTPVFDEPFPYESVMGELDYFLDLGQEASEKVIDSLRGIYNDIKETSSFTDATLKAFIKYENEAESTLLGTIKATNELFQEKCSLLNLDVRDLYAPSVLSKSKSPTLHRTKNVERVKKKGLWSGILRLVGNSSGYDFKTTYVTDHNKTKCELLSYYEECIAVLKGVISGWKSRNAVIRKIIEEEVTRQRSAFDERRSCILAARAYIDVADRLSELISQLPDVKTVDGGVMGTQIMKPDEEQFQIEMKESDLYWFSLASKMKKDIQAAILKDFLDADERILVIGGDIISEVFFLTQMLNVDTEENVIRGGKNEISHNILLYHGDRVQESVDTKDYSSVFILINGTQIGSAEGPLFSIGECLKEQKDVKLFWVVQDFQEVIDAKDVDGLLCELRRFAEESFSDMTITILLAHENPLYNLAIAAIQEKKQLLQVDQVVIKDYLGSYFSYLEESQSKDVIHDIFKAYNQRSYGR